MEGLRLNIGSGENKLKDYINVDKRKEANPDILLEVGVDKFPYEDNLVEEIIAHNSFEHFPNFLDTVNELARISKNGCTWIITLPYATSTLYNLVNPYHINPFFTEDTFRFFDDIYKREQPKWFKLKILETKFEYNTDLWGFNSEEKWGEYRRKYLNVVKSFTQIIQVVK